MQFYPVHSFTFPFFPHRVNFWTSLSGWLPQPTQNIRGTWVLYDIQGIQLELNGAWTLKTCLEICVLKICQSILLFSFVEELCGAVEHINGVGRGWISWLVWNKYGYSLQTVSGRLRTSLLFQKSAFEVFSFYDYLESVFCVTPWIY